MERFQVDVTADTIHRVISDYNPGVLRFQTQFIFEDVFKGGDVFRRVEQYFRAGSTIQEQKELRDVCVGQILQECNVIGEDYDYNSVDDFLLIDIIDFEFGD